MNYEMNHLDDKVQIIFNEPELLESFTEEKYGDLLMKAADEDKDIELNFSKVEVVDSLFIGNLIILHKKLEAKQKKLIFNGLNDFLSDLFTKLNLTKVLK